MAQRLPKMIILGHTGFIGAHLKRHVARSAKWDVIGHSLPAVDLTDKDQVGRLSPFFSADTTVILAAAVKRQFGDTLESFQKNTRIVENICQLLRTQPVKRLIFMSSAAVYGEETENTCISEETSVNPTSFYGINKFTSECLLRKTCSDICETSLVCLRPPLIYGPNDQGNTYGPSGFLAAAIEGRPITLWGDGSELREFIFINDLCRLIEYVATIEFEGILNVASGNAHCFSDVIDLIRTIEPNLQVNNRPRSKTKADNAFDATKIRKLLPSSFQFTSLKDGLVKMLNRGE